MQRHLHLEALPTIVARFRLLLGIHTLELQANLRLLGLLRHRLQLALAAVPAELQVIRLATTLVVELAKRRLQATQLRLARAEAQRHHLTLRPLMERLTVRAIAPLLRLIQILLAARAVRLLRLIRLRLAQVTAQRPRLTRPLRMEHRMAQRHRLILRLRLAHQTQHLKLLQHRLIQTQLALQTT